MTYKPIKQVSQINSKDIPQYINRQQDFISSSTRGINTLDHTYQVWSYNTLILEVRGVEVLHFDSSTYSKTTTKLQNIIKLLFFTEGAPDKSA